MKLYQKKPLGIEPPKGWEKIIGILFALIILVVLFGLLDFTIGGATQSKLIQNPLSLSQNESTILEVIVKNNTGESATNVTISANTPASETISITPNEQTIPILGMGESRKLEFLVVPLNPKSNPFYPGTYRIDITTNINNKTNTESIFLIVEK